MGTVIVKDLYFDEVEVSAASASNVEIDNGHREGGIVQLHVEPNGFSAAPDVLRYSPAQARRLAAALILAADKADGL